MKRKIKAVSKVERPPMSTECVCQTCAKPPNCNQAFDIMTCCGCVQVTKKVADCEWGRPCGETVP